MFSIIIPTYNRPRELAACLGALARLDYPRNLFEVIVVDDGSAVSLQSVIAAFEREIRISSIAQRNEGPSSARNAGAAHARGEILAFTDDDCLPAPGWLKTLAERFAGAADAVMVGGCTVNALAENPYATASQLIVEIGYDYHNGDAEHARFFTANNLALPAAQFKALGGFDAAFALTASEDRELCGRWLHQGYRMIYAREVLVYHAHALDWRSFWRQHFTYGRGALRLQRVRAQRHWQVFKPDPSYYSKLLFSPFSRMPKARALRLSGLLLASQCATAGGMVCEALRPSRTGSRAVEV